MLSLQSLTAFSAIVYVGSYQFMSYMAHATYSESGQLLDPGVDLNMEGAAISYRCYILLFNDQNIILYRHIKDLIILTAGVQILSLISNYFWLLWLLVDILTNYLHCFLYLMLQKDCMELLSLHILKILQVPLRGSWMLWKQILAPWFFAQPQEQSEMSEKKMRKLERKMAKRYQ